MLSKENEYIVKAKDLNLEIKYTMDDLINKFFIKDIIVYFVLLFFVLKQCNSFKSALIAFMVYTVVYVLLNFLLIIDNDWKIKIENKKVYIDQPMQHHVIDYADLIGFRYWMGPRRRLYFSIVYLKNRTVKKIDLPSARKLDSKIREICSSFITNEDLESGKQVGEEYFDVRSQYINPLIYKKYKITNERILIIFFILLAIFVIVTRIIFQFTLPNVF